MAKRGRRVPRYQRDSHARRGDVTPTAPELPSDAPTSQEINEFGSLDEIHAVKNFYGRSLSEAESLFEQNDIYYLSDLMWMGPKAYSYYVVAAINFLKSPSSHGHSDAVNIFWSIIDFRLCELRREAPTVVPILREAVLYVLGHWKKYHADPATYGDIKGKYSLLLRELRRSGPQSIDT